MADPQDAANSRNMRREFIKHHIDVTLADIRVTHGVVYVKGTVRAEKGSNFDIRLETERIGRLMRQRQGIRDVVIDCQYRT